MAAAGAGEALAAGDAGGAGTLRSHPLASRSAVAAIIQIRLRVHRIITKSSRVSRRAECTAAPGQATWSVGSLDAAALRRVDTSAMNGTREEHRISCKTAHSYGWT
jgi:hypothetical protein